MTHEVLIERIVQANEKAEAHAGSSAASARLLPGAGDAPRVAGEHRGVQIADVYAQLQGGGGNYTQKLTVEQILLYLTSLLGEVTTPVRLDPLD